MNVIKPAPAMADRPRCPNCNWPLRPIIRRVTELDRSKPGYAFRTVSTEWTGGYHAYGAFCTLRCCEAFANAAFAAGYRRK